MSHFHIATTIVVQSKKPIGPEWANKASYEDWCEDIVVIKSCSPLFFLLVLTLDKCCEDPKKIKIFYERKQKHTLHNDYSFSPHAVFNVSYISAKKFKSRKCPEGSNQTIKCLKSISLLLFALDIKCAKEILVRTFSSILDEKYQEAYWDPSKNNCNFQQ